MAWRREREVTCGAHVTEYFLNLLDPVYLILLVIGLVLAENFDPEEFRTGLEFNYTKMGSEDAVPLADQVNVAVEDSADQDYPGKKNKSKVPRRVHKSEREKQKREHLNELFFELSSAIELKQPNNGKASILCEASRLLKDLLAQIEGLRKENASLLSESHYVTVEKNELKEENSTLETQIGRLQSELEARVLHSKPDLNAPPPECLAMPADEPSLGQPHTVIVVPLIPDASQLPSNPPTSNVSKPHARYPTSADSWTSQLLREQQPKAGKELLKDRNRE
ncbi:Myc-type, basic helix-loop-helix (bHLH) domain containing protein [Trema orientale]|uniref:Myc-type, basic helix-loop-helix (BHLH) domain containing protein n=1 Tax=Trema orientale TaxID=63057 RepID=A0A2P5F799_TREOI|nr:Myc-type, basic helix-loop-helix (bHLH) domain containing protein [Trema orientale]